jgi:hypothetical protein
MEGTFIITKELMEIIHVNCISKGIFTKSSVPIGDYDIVYGNTQMYAYCDGDCAGNMDD